MRARRTIGLVSLGCPKNLVDSEGLVSTLISRGFQVLGDPEEADLVLVNTCGFLEVSRQESLAAIRDAVALKERGAKGVLVAGCMVGNYADVIAKHAPGVDALVGFGDYHRIDEVAERVLPDPEPATFSVERRRIDAALTPQHYAWLKVSEGCNHTCSFCVIPSIRGPMRSLPTEELVARARTLGERGVQELNLIAQDSTSYGADLYGEVRLAELLRRLDAEPGAPSWLRLMYAYPTEVRDDLADILAGGQRVLPYLDVPVQHAADGVLRRMRRGYGRRELDTMIERLRGRRSDLALRTTVIVGFPGETDADFEELLDFVREARFDRLGAFQYSREPNSRADALDDHVEDAVKAERFDRLMTTQQELVFAANRAHVGRRERVLVDWVAPDGSQARARSVRDAPEVDAAVILEGDGIRAGALLDVEITGTRGYDLTGRYEAAEMAV